MRLLRRGRSRARTAGQLLAHFSRRAWWLMPLVVVLVILSVVITVAQSTILGPFLYPLF